MEYRIKLMSRTCSQNLEDTESKRSCKVAVVVQKLPCFPSRALLSRVKTDAHQ